MFLRRKIPPFYLQMFTPHIFAIYPNFSQFKIASEADTL